MEGRMRVKGMGLVWSGVRIGVGVYVGLTLLLFVFQTHYIYAPDRVVDLTPADVGLGFDDVRLTTSDGETIAGWYVPAAESPETAPVVLFFHGNAGNMAGRLQSIQTFHDLGLSVLIIDYRGYGNSTGRPTEQGTRRDAEAAWNYVVNELGVPPERVIIFGRSLGGAVAVSLVAQHRPAMLVVESSFTSIIDMGRRMFPGLPVRPLCRHPYDSERTIASVTCPVLMAHGPEDETVPFALGQRLFEAANEPKRFVTLNGGHNDGGMDGDAAYRDVFKEWLTQFVQ